MSRASILLEAFFQCRSQLAGLISRIAPPQDVQDILQETYLRASKLNMDRKVHNPSSLLRKIAKNLSLDYVKRAEYRLAGAFVEENLPETADTGCAPVDPLSQAISDEEFSRFCLIVSKLSAQQRKVFILRKVLGYSQKEIAQYLGIAEGTVETHIARAMKHCVEHLMRTEHSAFTDTERVSAIK